MGDDFNKEPNSDQNLDKENKEKRDNLPYKEPEEIYLPDPDIIIPEEVKPLLSTLPESEQKKFQTALALSLSLSVKKTWNGPIPPPDILKEYNDAVPNGADRILAMAEKQSNHRMDLEKNVLNRELNQSGRGQNYGLVIAILFLIASVFLIYLGHDIAGGAIAGIDVVGLVYVFVIGKRAQKKDLEDKN